MSAIWRNDGDGWRLEAPSGFQDERALHDLVEQAPQLLPLAGTPTLSVLGREVRLGTGFADLLAIESSGRPVVIEVKLAYNAEARRAVISQVLTYAASLFRLSREQLEQDTLSRILAQRGYTTIAEVVAADAQAGDFDAQAFNSALEESLAAGRFRLVIVLDDAPAELVQLAGYLEAVTDNLTIDLVTVSRYHIGESVILIPQRLDPGRDVTEPPVRASASADGGGLLVEGATDFVNAIPSAPLDQQDKLRRMSDWAVAIGSEGLARLATYHGKDGRRLTLLPRLKTDNVGLVTIYNDANLAYLQFWRSVFERRAPKSLVRVNALLAPDEVRQGNAMTDVSQELLDALTDAYREAAAGVITS